MNKSKKSFIMYLDNKDVFYDLTDEQAGQLIKAIYKYQESGEITAKGLLKTVFLSFKGMLDRNEEKWEEIKQKRSDAGKKGMEIRWGKNNKIANDNKRYQSITKITDNVSVNDNVNVNDNVSVSVINNNAFTTPTLDELRSYCQDNNMNDFDCDNFFNYYEANGWLNNNGTPIKNWKAKIKYWYNDDKKNNKLVKYPDTSRRLD